VGQTSSQEKLGIEVTFMDSRHQTIIVCAILTAIFTWLALKFSWLMANIIPEIRGVTEL
jgi:hypothetical protein